ncbi:polyphosphate kinase 1 [Salinimicrobium tongyeongense]|uniref:Polyphosphate kinase n=1 Tax=Salinimicrobium tongyeongense TaxID=2809707 RepID=A0ABY6NQN4_9FLAO|nr:polyphosphate kinase 1 [Salinimicrobium tongyeongense]UZH55192.1 polyphosphate kinase 1 [Salinimicrobium tongyeongense]
MLKPEEKIKRHRDLNWLSFNERVLQEAQDKTTPLYERLKFLAIFSMNLDEYFRVRVSQLRQMKRVEKSIRKKLALKPNKTVKQILKEVREQQDKFGRIYREEIIPELETEGIYLVHREDYNEQQEEFARRYFKKVQKCINATTINSFGGEELFLENNGLYFMVCFKDKAEFGIVNIPTDECERFITFSSETEEYKISFLDDIVKVNVPKLFPEKEISGIYEIKLSRDAELYIDDEVDGLLAEKIYESLQQRTDGQPTRLLYDSNMPAEDQKILRKRLNLGKIDMMPGGRYHNFSDYFSFPDPTNNAALHYEKWTTVKHSVLEKAENYFEVIAKKDQSVHFPYMSFEYVERFIQQAAHDPQVKEIKISIYRIADESVVTSALLSALKNGKKLTVFIEAKARFDEKNNIDWGRKFEEEGARVIYSYPKIKVHSKILLVSREENGTLKDYAYIGTGNFNSKTSKIYCDHAIFTAHEKLTSELSRVFLVLEGELIIPRAKRLLISPFSTRKSFADMINREIENARLGKKAGIKAKMNSLEDKEIIDLLYDASEAGVNIRLLVRGFTCLVPGIENLSSNIYMTSIVDRFLEHGRIYIFENDGNEKLYFGSADWMTRNLDRRIEVIAPIYDKDIAQEFKDILEIQFQDNVKARIQDSEEKNNFVGASPGEKKIRSQYEIYKYLKEKHAP